MNRQRQPARRNGTLSAFVGAQKRELRHFATELIAVRGIFPLLMKPRNGGQWTVSERNELLLQLRRLSRLSPALIFLLLPGSALLLPAYAWWLDRRRGVRETADNRPASASPDSLRP